jgi:glycosyltransferase involved in cell wall biosynthesis
LRILLRAPLLTSSGYGVHSRQIFQAIESIPGINLEVECLNWGNTPWLINKETNDGLIGRIMKLSKKVEPPYDLTVQVQLPDEWDPSLGHKNIGISAMVETDRCNPKWVDACNKMDHVVVPSSFTKSVIRKSGVVNTAITVIPEWFNQYILDNSKLNIEKDVIVKTKHNFLILGQMGSPNAEDDRKNIFNTIKWLSEHFKNRNDVGIILKTNMGRNTSIDKKITINIIEQMKQHIGPSNVKIYLLHGTMSDQEIASLYLHKDIKCLVAATRGEGYGLPLIEAAAAGMPVIATNWSGHLDFLKQGSFLPVNYALKEIQDSRVDNRIFLKGFKWAEPDEASFKQCLQAIIDNYDIIKSKSENYKEYIRSNFSKSNISNIYKDLITEVLG